MHLLETTLLREIKWHLNPLVFIEIHSRDLLAQIFESVEIITIRIYPLFTPLKKQKKNPFWIKFSSYLTENWCSNTEIAVEGTFHCKLYCIIKVYNCNFTPSLTFLTITTKETYFHHFDVLRFRKIGLFLCSKENFFKLLRRRRRGMKETRKSVIITCIKWN